MALVYLSLGSNKGDRLGYIQQVTSLLNSSENINVVQSSSFYETEPWQTETENWFVNAVIQVSTNLSPKALLLQCQKFENLLGRNREAEGKYGDRTVDIDILFYDDKIVSEDIDNQHLTIPHPLLHERGFTLVPMLEIAPDFIHPIFKKSISDLYEELDEPGVVYLYGTRI